VKLGLGLIGTMSALVLGLLVASAKGSYDTKKAEINTMSAKVVLLDRVLARFGPESNEARELLRSTTERAIDRLWPRDSSKTHQADPAPGGGEALFYGIQELTPKNDAQHSLKAQAENISMALGETRWLMFAQEGRSVSMPLLAVVVLWLTVIFTGYGLVAPYNATVIATLFVCALSVSAAILLILEMDMPFEGLVQISSAPLRNAVAHLGQ
jgi:hypothetical protein